MKSFEIGPVLAAMTVLALWPAGTARAAAWPQPSANATHDGFNKAEKTITAGNAATLSVKWSIHLAGPGYGIFVQPIEAGGTVYAVDNSGTIYAVALATGKLRWTHVVGPNLPWSLSSSNGRIYTPCPLDANDTTFCALDAKTGALVWQYNALLQNVTTGVTTGPVVDDGQIFYYQGNSGDYGKQGGFYILDAATGTRNYFLNSCGDTNQACDNAERFATLPAAAAGGYYYYEAPLTEDGNGGLCKRAEADGSLAWCTDTSFFGSMPSVVGGRVYASIQKAGSSNTYLSAYSAATGAPIFAYAIPNVPGNPSNGQPPAVEGGIAYYSEYNVLYALDAHNGHLIWSFNGYQTAYGQVQAGVTVADGVVYSNCQNGDCAFDAKTGTPLWSSAQGSGATPIVVNGMEIGVCGGTSWLCAYVPGDRIAGKRKPD